ncbi:MAG: hypothetical protein H0W84_06110 [Bacteroidetes bacterium]|nr:hypothetical protein [Bacteroidota bacterium]
MSFKIIIKHNWNKLRLYLSFLLLAFYLTLAFLFLFSDTWVDLIPKGRVIIGLVFLLFGSLRFYVAYHRYKNKHIKIKALKESIDQSASAHTSTEPVQSCAEGLSMTDRAESV